jgi:hypothetical protein
MIRLWPLRRPQPAHAGVLNFVAGMARITPRPKRRFLKLFSKRSWRR